METKSSKVIFIVAVVALVIALGAVAIAGVALALADRDGRGCGGAENGRSMMRGDIGPRGEDRLPQLRDQGPGMGLGLRAELQKAAEALGMTEQDLRTELQGGKTLAQVAQEKGVDTQKLVDAMLSQAKTDLAQQVANGRITQSEADQTLQELTTRVQTLINSGQPGRFGGWSGPPCIVGTEAQAS